MAYRASRGSIISLCLGLLVFVTSHCHCTTLTRLKALDELKEGSMHTQSQAESQSRQHHGKLLIGQTSGQDTKLNGTGSTNGTLDVESDYQADMGWWQNKQHDGQGAGSTLDATAIQHVLKLDPRVECTGDSMRLLVQDAASTPASLLFVDRGRLSPLSLSKLPSSCGYTIRSTRRDLILSAPYDGCFVILEEDSYILPLLWWGLPVRMSCPLMRHMSPSPPMVTCHAEGMVVKTDWTNSASRMKVNVNGHWEPLLKASQRCVFGIVEHPEGLVLSVHYSPCLEKKDGLYTLELAAEGEIKISCPPLLPVHPQSAKDPAKGQLQTDLASKWQYSSHSTSAHLPGQTVHEVPVLPQNQQIPNKPGQGQKEISHGFSYSPFQNFVHPNLARPGGPPTSQQISQTPTPQTVGKLQLPAQSPVTRLPGKYEEPILQNPFNLPPGFSQKPAQPPAGQSKGQDQTQLNQLLCTQMSQDPSLQKLCLEKFPEKPGQLHPKLPENPRGDLYQPYFLFYPQQRPASKSTGGSQSQQLGATQGHMYQPFYPLYTQRPATKPTGVSQSQQPGPTQGHMYQPFYPLYTQRPATKPAGVSQSQQPGPTQGHMYQPFYPLYTQRPATKPAGVSKPGASQGHMYQPFYPLYTQPKPVTKPAGISRPLQPATPPGPVQQKPGVQMPSKPTQPQQPESPRGQMYKPFYPYMYTKPKPAVKPTGVSQLSQPVTPQSQVQQPPHPQPKPGDHLAVKPAVPHPEAPLDQWHQQMCLYTQLMAQNQLANKPTADQKPTENMQGLFYGPCQPYGMAGTGTNYGTSMENLRQSSQMSIVKLPHGQVAYPSNLVYYLQQPHYLTMPSATSVQQVTALGGNSKRDASISQTGDVGISPQAPFYCPQFCPSGFGNCCIQIAFHQHLHIFPAGFEGKDAAPFYPGLPLSAVAHAEVGNSFELLPFHQLADLTRATGAGISAQMLPQLVAATDKKQPHGQPPDGNPVLPGSSPSNAASPQVLVYPYFPTDLLYPHWPHLPQNMDLQQGKSVAFSNPSKPWVSGDKPLAHYGLYNIEFPPKSNQFLGGNNPSRSNLMTVNQFSPRSDQQNKPAGNELQSLNEEFGAYRYINQFSPYYMPQDAPVLTQNDSLALNNSQAQSFEGDSKNSTKPEQSLGYHSAPQSYVLLQYGPPGREQNRFSDSPVPFKDLVHSTSAETLNLAQHRTNPLNFELLQEKGPQLKWMGEETFSPLPGDNFMQRLDELGFPSFSPTVVEPQQMHLPPEQSPSAEHLKPEALDTFEDPWKSLTPTSSSQKFPPHVSGKVFPQWNSMADEPANGKDQSLLTEHGNQKAI